MKFSALAEILEKAGLVTDVRISEDCEITDLNLMDREDRDFSSGTVYFIDSAQIGPATAFPKCLFYLHDIPENRAGDLINGGRITAPSIAAVFRHVKAQLDSAPQAQEQYANLMAKLVAGVELKTILSEAFSYTGNLFVALDMSGKILEHSTPFYVDYPLWMNSVQQGFCDEVLMNYIESRRKNLRAPQGEAPFALYCRKIDMHILVARIIHENELLGYFFALSKNPTFDNYTKRVLPLFAQRAKEGILRLKHINSYSAIMQTNILLDAVAGASPAETRLRAKISGLKFQRYMRVMVIRASYSKDPDFYSQVLLPELTEILPNQPCFPWQSSLIYLVGTDANGSVAPEQHEAVTGFMEKRHLLAGVSNMFSAISEFAEHFEQARTALSFSNRTSSPGPLFYYLDYALFMILDRIDDEKFLDNCCHPALARLVNYDEKKGTELFNTLRAYTEVGFSKTRTAQELFIHRNTINYRIQQIEELCGIDLSNEKLLFPLQLSFNLYAYRQSRVITGN